MRKCSSVAMRESTLRLPSDFVIERGERLLPVEVKATARPGSSDVRGIAAFRDEYAERFAGGLLLHAGEEVQWLADRVLAAPWYRVL